MSLSHIVRNNFSAMAIFLAVALSWLSANARQPGNPAVDPEIDADSLSVSFITCYPGPEIYELYGHEAVRIKGEGRDSVWNYGIFDFRKPNFVYRFVKGETDYMVAGYPFGWFLPEYISRGSRIVEQKLNLSQPEARKLLSMLQTESLPQNREYRYNYVKNNCATRIHQLLDSAASSRVIYPDSVAFGTFRNEMRAYNKNYPWYQFGIDIALGSGIDKPLKARDEMFVPVEMMRMVDGARLEDGRPLVRESIVINEGVDATLPPTPWYASPLFWAWVLFAAFTLTCIIQLKRNRIYRWIYSLWLLVLGLAGTLVAFLVFISSHEATSPNALVFWLNPLQLVAAVCIWWKSMKPLSMAIACYDIMVPLCLLIVWPLQSQSTNPALFPLLGATIIMAASYAIIAGRNSYNINRRVSASTSAESSSPDRKKKTPAKQIRKKTGK